MNDNEILFITTTRYTPWLKWCKKSVKQFFPNSNHLIIDGRQNWPNVWFEWINHLKNYNEQIFITIDEDCFVINRKAVEEAILKLRNNNATLAGVHDAYFTWRGFNEVALNPFFMIGDRSKLIDVVTRIPYYRNLIFNPKYFETAKYEWEIQNRQMIGHNYEPFYCLFWAVIEANQKLLYLYPHDKMEFVNQYNKLPATSVRVSPESDDMALHMWYSREWNNDINLQRYQKLEKYLTQIVS